MPVYEYRCKKGHTYEKTESFSAPTRQKCPTCRSQAERVISMPAVIFKGSGFYSTDNRGSSSLAGTSRDSDSGSSDGAADAAVATAASDATSTSDGHGHSHGPGGHTH